MRLHSHIGILRATLLGSMGVTLVGACSGESSEEPGIQPGGFAKTAGGFWHRPEVGACGNHLPMDAQVPSEGGPFSEQCQTHAECPASHYCGLYGQLGNGILICKPGCVEDSQCGEAQICFCQEPIGRCVTASCITDADCNGDLCLENRMKDPCGGEDIIRFECGQPGTECTQDSDCAATSTYGVCAAGNCTGGAVCGRPFYVAGVERRACAVSRSDWGSTVTPKLGELSATERATLGEHWTEIGLMEHASVAAFARFTLELLAIGAPPELVRASQEAMGDEIEHARVAFGFASAYAGVATGPGELSLSGVHVGEIDFAAIVRGAFLEMCVGETCAAAEVREAALRATDPEVRARLEQIAEEELRHAALGYRFLKWALAQSSMDGCELLELVSLAGNGSQPELNGKTSPALEVHGYLSLRDRAQVRALTLREVVLPCVRALVSSASASARGGVREVVNAVP